MSEETTTGSETESGNAGWWGDALPDDLKGNDSLKRYTDLEGAARGLIHYSGLFGVPNEQLLRLPKPDDAEGMAKVYDALGRPESPDKYGIKPPEGSNIDEAALSGFLAAMHPAGLTPKQAEAALAWYSGYAQQTTQAIAEQIKTERETAFNGLKAEWGEAYKVKSEAAFALAERLGGKELREALDETGMGNDPRIIKAFAAMAELVKEAGPPPTDRQDDKPGALTPAQAEAELVKLEGDEAFRKALEDANHPNHGWAVNRRLELIKAKRPPAAQ